MINLLTPDALCTVRRTYWVRVITVWSIVGTVAAVVAGALLLPPYVLIASQIRVYEAGATEAAAKIATYQTASAALIAATTQARWVVDSVEQTPLTTVLSTLESALPESVRLTGIEFARTDSGFSPITLSGVAATRRDVVEVEEIIEALPEVASASLPVTNLTARAEVPFTMTITWSTEE